MSENAFSVSNETKSRTFDAPAKVNLTLKVIGRRADGYHQIESITAFAHDVCDRLIVRESNTIQVLSSGPFANRIDECNLIVTAMEEVAKSNPRAILAEIGLEKNIPVAAGLGGGSADAAATLRALQIINREITTDIDWQAISIRLGADVPVCLQARTSLVRGIGEIVEPLPTPAPFAVVLVNTNAPVPANKTARVFSLLNAPTLDPGHQLPVINKVDVWHITQMTGNDLEATAIKLMPDIRDAKVAIENTNGCLLARLSGAGPTCFGLYESSYGANAARDHIRQANPSWWVASSDLV